MSNKTDSLRENEIRSDQYAAEARRLYERDVEKLMDQKDQFVDVSCPACGKQNYKKWGHKYKITYVMCDNCETVFVNPRPTPEMLNDYYENPESYYNFWNNVIFPASESARREKIFKPRAELVKRLCTQHPIETNTLVDVGAGFGTFCEEVKKLNLFDRVIAIEPTTSLAETCKKRGLEVINKPIEEAALEREINVITNFEVIEHLFSPEDFLRSCHKALSPGGVMMITCPNIKGFDIEVLREVSDNMDAEHLNYFHPVSLRILFQRCGFRVIYVRTPGKLDAELVRKKVLAGEFSLDNEPFLKQILIDEWDIRGDVFQQFLSKHNLSSNMLMVAQMF